MKAFPQMNVSIDKDTVVEKDVRNGMDLRDYFAAKALMSMGHSYENLIDSKTIAHRAYAMADAMMEARKPK